MAETRWIEQFCGNCEKLIHALGASHARFLGGWVPCWRCGWETKFGPSSEPGRCESIEVRQPSLASRT